MPCAAKRASGTSSGKLNFGSSNALRLMRMVWIEVPLDAAE